MKKYLNSRSILIFFSVFLCVVVITCGSTAYVYQRNEVRERNDYDRILDGELDRAGGYISQSLTSASTLCNGIFSDRWYTHFTNGYGVYEEEFTGEKHEELVRMLQHQLYSLPLINDILVIAPFSDTVISGSGWYTIRMYENTYQRLHIDFCNGFNSYPHITVTDDRYAVIVLNDPTGHRYKNVICMVLKKATFVGQLNALLGPYAVNTKACLGNQELVNTGEYTDGIVLTYHDAGNLFALTVEYMPYMASGRGLFVSLLITLIILSALVAFVVTLIAVKPVNELVLTFGGEKQDLDSPYRFIYQYVDGFLNKGVQLTQENSMLKQQRSHFLSVMRNEMVIGMLTNRDYDFHADYIDPSFRWLNDTHCFLVAVCTLIHAGDTPIGMAGDYCASASHSCFAEMGNEHWFIYGFASVEQLEKGIEELSVSLKNTHYAVSDSLNSTQEFANCCRHLKEELDSRRLNWRTIPMLLESRLVGRIRAGHTAEALQLLEEACTCHNPEAVMWMLTRLSGECGYDMNAVMEQLAVCGCQSVHGLQLLKDWTAGICSFLAADRASTAQENASAQAICDYIRENYADANMSVNVLADVFGMHRTLISKAVKAYTGETFSDFLMHLRIEAADDLLRTTTENAASIAEKVGIPNYTTFTRSFQKVHQMTPNEWRSSI